MAVRDQAAQSIENSYDLFTSDLGFWRVRGPLTLGADATLMQDMRIVDGNAPDRRLFGADGGRTFQRLPALFAQLSPVPFGRATFAFEASAVQFARFGDPTEMERKTGFGPTDRANSPAAIYTDASRAPVLRLDLAPRFTLAAAPAFPAELAWKQARAWMAGSWKGFRIGTGRARMPSSERARRSPWSGDSEACCTASSQRSSCVRSRSRSPRVALHSEI